MQLHRENILNIVLACKIYTTRKDGQTELYQANKNFRMKKRWL